MSVKKLLTGVALASALASLVAVVATGAEAQRGRRGRAARRSAATAGPAEAPESAAIAPALGELRWGMGPREAFEHLQHEIEASYRERMQKAARTDAVQEDRLRQQMQADMRRLRGSFVRFRGETTGWDSSFLRDEFTHGNNESMMVWRDEATHSQRFYFFMQDRLWKVYQAFDASVFRGATFEQFAEAIQGRFGAGVTRTGSLVEGRPPTRWIEWQDSTTRLRAVDQTRFYGFFCLVFEEEATLDRLPQLRTHTTTTAGGGHAVVDSILRDGEAVPGGSEETSDSHADIADRLTGQIRRRSDAPEGGSASASSGSRSGSSGSSGSSSSGSSGSSSSRSSSRDDDPFAGMDL